MKLLILAGLALFLGRPGYGVCPFYADTLSDIENRIYKVTLPTARGEKNERIVAFRVFAEQQDRQVTQVSLDFTGTTNLKDYDAVYIWHNHDQRRFSPETAKLFGKASPARGIITVPGKADLTPGVHIFWITADVNPRAREGNKLEISPISYLIDNRRKVLIPAVSGNRTILLTHTLLFSGGDYGSRHYRIPALTEARNGNLVTLTDKRWKNPYDLPGHIDVVARYSSDKGKTWSKPVTIAGDNDPIGFGDAALLTNQTNGEILSLFASGQGFFWSRRDKPIRIFQSISADHGVTWSVPQDLTPQIYGYDCDNPLTNSWQGAFVSSGNLVQLRNGRLLAALVVREGAGFDISNYVMYSDDHGRSWQVSPNRVARHGNEAKIVELANGALLMSIRTRGFRKFVKSHDQGVSWSEVEERREIIDPSCNGSLTRYSTIEQGAARNRLLHSIPLSGTRENLSILVSYDEGDTWPVKKTVCAGAAAYSSLIRLRDGTIGLYYESGEYEVYQMYFARFSLDWLTGGEDIPDFSFKDEFLGEATPSSLTDDWWVYPNPAHASFQISGPFKTGDWIMLISGTGQVVRQERVERERSAIIWECTDLPAGLYWIRTEKGTRPLVIY